MTWVDWAEVLAVSVICLLFGGIAVSMALDNFNLWRRKR